MAVISNCQQRLAFTGLTLRNHRLETLALGLTEFIWVDERHMRKRAPGADC